jgi:hypothetical protein
MVRTGTQRVRHTVFIRQANSSPVDEASPSSRACGPRKNHNARPLLSSDRKRARTDEAGAKAHPPFMMAAGEKLTVRVVNTDIWNTFGPPSVFHLRCPCCGALQGCRPKRQIGISWAVSRECAIRRPNERLAGAAGKGMGTIDRADSRSVAGGLDGRSVTPIGSISASQRDALHHANASSIQARSASPLADTIVAKFR